MMAPRRVIQEEVDALKIEPPVLAVDVLVPVAEVLVEVVVTVVIVPVLVPVPVIEPVDVDTESVPRVDVGTPVPGVVVVVPLPGVPCN